MVVSVLGFGGSEIGYDRVAVRTVERLLGSALDAGLNVIDTAECYEDGEELIGKAVGSRRREFYLLTKCGHSRGWGRGDWRLKSLLASIERSLKRLATDHVDLIQLHSCSLAELEKGDAIEALERALNGVDDRRRIGSIESRSGTAEFLNQPGHGRAGGDYQRNGIGDRLDRDGGIGDGEAR